MRSNFLVHFLILPDWNILLLDSPGLQWLQRCANSMQQVQPYQVRGAEGLLLIEVHAFNKIIAFY